MLDFKDIYLNANIKHMIKSVSTLKETIQLCRLQKQTTDTINEFYNKVHLETKA